MSVWSSVGAAVEEAHKRQEKFRYDGKNRASIILRCPWADRYTVANDVLNRAWPGGGGMLAGEIDIVPAPSSAYRVTNGENIYDEALITISYDVAELGNLDTASYPPDSGASRKYRESLEPFVEYYKLPKDNFAFGSATGRALTPEEAPLRQFRGFQLIRTIYGVENLPSDLLTLGDHTNSAQYVSASLGITFPVDTLLFCKPTIERTVEIGGNKAFNLTIKFAHKDQGWNKYWDDQKVGGPGFDIIWDKVNDQRYFNFPQGSFANYLF